MSIKSLLRDCDWSDSQGQVSHLISCFLAEESTLSLTGVAASQEVIADRVFSRVQVANSAGTDCQGEANRMGSLLGDLPSYNPHNFSQLRPSDRVPSLQTRPKTYYPTHGRTLPPPHQVIATEATNILLRHFYELSEQKHRPKRPALDTPGPNEHVSKQPRRGPSSSGDPEFL